jgi:hypothetical protein
MTVRLNERAYEHAKRLIKEGKFVDDEREAWSDHHPPTLTEEEFIEEDKTRHYEFPHGDLKNVHRCSILAAQGRAGQEKYFDIKNAAADLLTVIDRQAQKQNAQ